jgi:CheY-like chemotaxis protein
MTLAPGILLIEPEGDAPGLTERVLRKYRIDNLLEKAPDGERAIALLRKGFAERVQLALLDYTAPGMPALETLMRIRGIPGLDQLPIIVSCGSPEEERLVREWNTRRTICMSKPPGFFKLLECIQKLEMHWFVFGSKAA